MKKLLLILITAVIIFTGCIGSENAEKTSSPVNSIDSASLQTTSKSGNDIQAPDSILKLSDLPKGFMLKSYGKYAVPKKAVCKLSSNCQLTGYQGDTPINSRFLGGHAEYSDKSEGKIFVDYKIYDSNEGMKEAIDFNKNNMLSRGGAEGLVKAGQPNIGEYSAWITTSFPANPDLMETRLYFFNKYSFVSITVLYDKDKSLGEAINIAKIIESRVGSVVPVKTTPRSDLQIPDIIFKSDLPAGFDLDYYDYYIAPKTSICYIYFEKCPLKRYQDKMDIPVGDNRFIGYDVHYKNNEKYIVVGYKTLDSVDGVKKYIDDQTAQPQGPCKTQVECSGYIKRDQSNIGEYSAWKVAGPYADRSGHYNLEEARLYFLDKHSIVNVIVVYDKDQSLNEAIRIAKIVEKRIG